MKRILIICLLFAFGAGCSKRPVGVSGDGDGGTHNDGAVHPSDGNVTGDGFLPYDGSTPPLMMECADRTYPPGPLGRVCHDGDPCADLPGGFCRVLAGIDGETVRFCTRACATDAECGAGATCQTIWCHSGQVCMPSGCCQGREYCSADSVCVVNRPGGLCPDGPCCSAPFGTYACRLLCDQGNNRCPDTAPNCTRVEIGTEDYVESFMVCLP